MCDGDSQVPSLGDLEAIIASAASNLRSQPPRLPPTHAPTHAPTPQSVSISTAAVQLQSILKKRKVEERSE